MESFVVSRSWTMTDFGTNDIWGTEPWFGYSGGYPQPSTYNVVDNVSPSDISKNVFNPPEEAPPVYEQQAPTASEPPEPKRPRGNNPFGSRGCASCIRCRKRKGKVLRFHALLTAVRVQVPDRSLFILSEVWSRLRSQNHQS
jgi:hypothetical protein